MVVIVLAIILILSAHCSGKSPVSSQELNSSLTVLVTDEQGEPIRDVIIHLEYKSLSDTTGSDGTVFFDSLPAQTVKCTGSKEGCPAFSKDVSVKRNQETAVNLTIYSALKIRIKDDCDRIIGNVDISTSPATQSVRADENGYAVLRNIPEQLYVFTMTRENLPTCKKNVAITSDTGAEIELVIESAIPEVRLDEPANNGVLSAYDVVFRGYAADAEDGELPDSLLVWYSDIDGKLGTGKTLTVGTLREGFHQIRLEATDSDGKMNSATIAITTVDYDPTTFFPLKTDSFWQYSHPEPNFFVINRNNVNEFWQINDLTITYDTRNRRTTTVYYDRTIGTLITHCKYVLVDYLETTDENVYVSMTTEELTEWEKSGNEEKTSMLIRSETKYSPYYLVFPAISDPLVKTTCENTVKIETEWYYIYYNIPSSTYHESRMLTTTIETGGMNFIQTGKGVFKAIEVAISQDGKVRTWWLTRGLGIVRFDYGISTVEQTAILKDSDLFDLYRPEEQARIAGGNGEYKPGPTAVYRLPEDTSDAARELMAILRSMAP